MSRGPFGVKWSNFVDPNGFEQLYRPHEQNFYCATEQGGVIAIRKSLVELLVVADGHAVPGVFLTMNKQLLAEGLPNGRWKWTPDSTPYRRDAEAWALREKRGLDRIVAMLQQPSKLSALLERSPQSASSPRWAKATRS